jgi:hypothetical protein
MISATDNGIVNKPSNHSVEETVEKLKGILLAKGVMLFALVDHSGEAERTGMKMRPTKLLIFGNPKAGTPLMLASPSSAAALRQREVPRRSHDVNWLRRWPLSTSSLLGELNFAPAR